MYAPSITLSRARWLPRPPALLLIALIALAGVRDGMRRQAVGEYFRLEDMPVRPQWGALAVFLVTFVLGLGAVAWMLRLIARSRITPEP